MAAALRARGPDDEGFLIYPGAGLTARRLAIVDVAAGQQPLTNEDGSIAVAFNGEIYNAEALRRRLLAQGHRLRSRCDTELLPHLYEEHGPQFVDTIEGDFAIAVWDNRAGKLLLTRDRIGVKPLYYAEQATGLLFASEIKGVVAGLEQRPSLNLEAIYHYLSLKHVPNPFSAYRGIRAVQPGEQITLASGRLTSRRYWRWPLTEGAQSSTASVARVDGVDPSSAVDALDTLLNESVRARLCGDQPVGALLSGGLDSSLLVAIAARHSSTAIDTFTLCYGEQHESKRADTLAACVVATRFGTRHHECRIDAEELRRCLPAVLSAFDEPFAGVVSTFFLSRLIARHVKACLSGDGADELFGSYLAHRLAQPIAAARRVGLEGLRQNPALAAPFENELERVARLAGADESGVRAGLMVFSDAEKRALLNPDWRDFNRLSSEELIRERYEAFMTEDSQTRAQLLDCCTLLPDHVLCFSDRLSMAHSVEVRVPFLAHPFAELATRLPGELKIRAGVCKWILKQLARRYLPAAIVDRPKEGFVPPVNVWMRESFSDWLADTLAPERLASHGLFRPQVVADLLRRYRAGDSELQYKVWSLFCFQLWHDHVFNAAPRSDLETAGGDVLATPTACADHYTAAGQRGASAEHRLAPALVRHAQVENSHA